MYSSILNYFLIFFIYSVLGWLMESTFVSITERKFVNRGFLIGPYCPIYGFGSIMIILYLNQYKDNIVTVFILGVVICSLLEYLTSYFMEKIFKARWWDYSNKKFNLNGRICGENAILFGMGGLLIIYIIHPFIDNLLKNINNTILTIFSIIFLITYVMDTILSFNIVNKLKKNLNNIDIKQDSTQDIRKMISDIINNNISTSKFNLNLLQKRIIKAFPNFDFIKFIEDNKKEIKRFFHKKIHK